MVATAELLQTFGSLKDDTSFIPASIHSLAVILITEIGDKTFFIAAVLAMRFGRIVVYSGAMGALATMHVLSVLMGYALPSLIPKSYTHFASAILFAYFGFKLLKDAYEMEGSGPSEELQEVEDELIKKKGHDHEDSGDVEGGSSPNKDSGDSSKVTRSTNASATENARVFMQAFTLTFLAEWGDRSQIATIALAASRNPFGVIIGGLLGHGFCTGLAVIGGRMLAAKISEKHVATIGGILFIVFAVHAFMFGPEN